MKTFLVALLFSLTSVLAQAFTVPALTGPVVDQVHLLTENQRAELESIAHSFRDQHQAQIQVLIVPDLQGEAIESVAIQVFDKWKLGDAKRDDGILLLFAINDKKMRIEVGQGLEGSVPDVIAKRIISEIMRPYFQQGDFFIGIKLGTLAIQSAITGDRNDFAINKNNAPKIKKNGSKIDIYVIGIIFFIWLIIFIISPSTGINILLAVLSSRGGRSSNGGSGSRGWGGGGGSSSGGGASGGW